MALYFTVKFARHQVKETHNSAILQIQFYTRKWIEQIYETAISKENIEDVTIYRILYRL